MFAHYEYVKVDNLRQRVWLNPSVQYWYAQNAVLFASASFLQANARLQDECKRVADLPSRLVHPELLEHYVNQAKWLEEKANGFAAHVEILQERVSNLDADIEKHEADLREHRAAPSILQSQIQEHIARLELQVMRTAALQRQHQEILSEREAQIQQLEFAPPIRVVLRGLRQLALPLNSRRYSVYKRIRRVIPGWDEMV